MKSTLPTFDKYSYLISLGLHALLLLIFAIISFNVAKPQTKWHQFDWIIEPESEGVIGSYPNANEGMPESAGAMAKPAEVLPAQKSPALHDIESPLLESPAQTKPKIETAPLRESPFTQSQSTSAGTGTGVAGSSGLSMSLIEGGSDAYFIRETKPKITPLENDVVIVEFSLSADGRVQMNSLNVISYRRAAHWEALREEMHAWRFGFTGTYKPEKRYRIRCNFHLR